MGLKFSKLYPILRFSPRLGYIKVKIANTDKTEIMIGGDPGKYANFEVEDIETSVYDGKGIIPLTEPLTNYTVTLDSCKEYENLNCMGFEILNESWSAKLENDNLCYSTIVTIPHLYADNIVLDIDESIKDCISNMRCKKPHILYKQVVFTSDSRPLVDIGACVLYDYDNHGNQDKATISLWKLNNDYNRHVK